MQREFFIQQLGGLPPRTPLNAKVVGKLHGDGFRGEKIMFESQPNVFVSAIMFLPTTKPPYPAVLIPCGHNASGKAGQQRAMILLTGNGIAALSYDPVGQGERYLILDDEGNRVHRSVDEHTLLGVASMPVGRNAATYRVWDGLRAVDYLASRKDIDAGRLGVTGCSGGGTMTSYLMALDERLEAAAPSCYITSFDRLIDTAGPQDAEQNIHGQIAFGMDHADYVHMRAPRPTLILASTHDFFDIDGVWQTFREAKQLFTRMGVPHRVSVIEADQRHGFPSEHRVAMTNWMLRWLADNDTEVSEPETEVFSNEQVRCTPRGQVMLLPDARSAFDLNVDEDERLAPQRAALWKNNRDEALSHVRRLAGIRPLTDLPQREVQHVGEVKRDGYQIEKLILHPEADIRLPALVFVPNEPRGEAVLYLHGEGKQADAGTGGPIEQLVRDGHVVLAVDLRGLGETQRTGGGNLGRLFGDWQTNLLAYLMAKPVVGMRKAHHGFQNWLEADQEVFGVDYRGHYRHNKRDEDSMWIVAEKKDHALVKGHKALMPAGGLYRHTDIADDVEVLKLPERLVASIGVRGSYSEANFREAEQALKSWIDRKQDVEASGDAPRQPLARLPGRLRGGGVDPGRGTAGCRIANRPDPPARQAVDSSRKAMSKCRCR